VSKLKIRPATRVQRFARIALEGPSSSGKTWTALSIARDLTVGNGKPVLLIDTEHSSGSLYSDKVEYLHADWEPPYDPVSLATELRALAGDHSVIIIDSLSHFWIGPGGVLDIVERAGERARGNRFAGWRTGTPAHNTLIDTIISLPTHVIATMRVKTEWAIQSDERGKDKPVKIGMGPIQRDGIDYEFTVVGELDLDHRLMISKSRCSALADRVFPKETHGQAVKLLREWLAGAQEVVDPQEVEEIVAEPGEPTLVPGGEAVRLRSELWDAVMRMEAQTLQTVFNTTDPALIKVAVEDLDYADLKELHAVLCANA
jgi:hypothetical protein